MATWNAPQPCRDLAARVPLAQPGSIIDLGCGPGKSTQMLAERWLAAQFTGLNNSIKMIAQPRASHPDRGWTTGNIAE